MSAAGSRQAPAAVRLPPDLPPKRPHLLALTGVRFAAALLVVCLHARHTLEGSLSPQWAAFISSGQVGVSLFFILSGLILTYTYAGPDGRLNTSRREFWLARVARIYPVYLLGLVLSAPYFLLPVLHRWPTTTEWVTALLTPALLQAWLPQTACVWNCPGWSLSAEAFFYALFPVALGWRLWVHGRVRQVRWPLTALWIATLVPPLIYVAMTRPMPAESLVADTFYYGPLFRLPEFLLGILLGWQLLQVKGAGRAALWSVVGLVGSAALMVWGHTVFPPILNKVMIVPFLALLLWGLAHGRGWVARVFAWSPLVVLGEASYSLYILHVPVYLWLSSAWRRVLPGVPQELAFFLVYLAVLIPLSLVTYLALERPAQRLLRRRWQTRPAAPVISSAP
ncbi:acyltransferase family protein [Deinococcus oregonensis]|uniref:Acyltransferase family protein n=1 Tax=Deinococcus oregonensis TaxID=1805970 RepID=A0ABV6AV49_9DEIO